MRTVEASPPVPDARRLPTPERLSPQLRTSTGFVPAAVALGTDTTSIVAVTVRGTLDEAHRATAGVAIFAQQTGAKFTWVPLASTTPAADGSLSFDMPTTVVGELVVTLATERDFARHGYLARRIVLVGRNAPRAEALFDAVATPVHFTLPAALQQKTPLRVVRIDDAEWLPMHLGSSGLVLTAETSTFVFGAGSYELQDPIDPAARQSFVVPTSDPVAISATLSRPRAGRP